MDYFGDRGFDAIYSKEDINKKWMGIIVGYPIIAAILSAVLTLF